MDRSARSRLRWRCRRGMRELDVLLMSYLDHEFDTAGTEQQTAFTQLLILPDPEILALLTGRASTDDAAQHAVVQRLLAQSRRAAGPA